MNDDSSNNKENISIIEPEIEISEEEHKKERPSKYTNGKNYDFSYKLLLLGESGVGKTSLLLKFADDVFNSNYLTTIGIDFKIKYIELEGKIIKLHVWDTAGQERYKSIAKTYYKGVDGIVIIYDVTDEKSFANIKHWYNQINENAKEDVCKILIGNKCDREGRKITYEQGIKTAQLSNQINSSKNYSSEEKILPVFFETSAKTGYNVNDFFYSITKKIHQKKLKEIENENMKNISLIDSNKKEESSCCK